MSSCGARFISSEDRQHRICVLEEGHAEDCAGGLNPAARQAARRASRARNAEAERLGAQARAEAPQALPGGNLTPAALAALVVEAAGQPSGASLGQALSFIRRRAGFAELRIGGIRLGIREIRQVAARLERDGLLDCCGETLLTRKVVK